MGNWAIWKVWIRDLRPLLYAGDRLEAKSELDAALHSGEIVIADRYVASNLAHQGARCPREKRDEFIAWVRHLEYEIYGLPKENLVIYLRLSPMQSQKMVLQKAARNYTAATHDLLESTCCTWKGLRKFLIRWRSMRHGRQFSVLIPCATICGHRTRFPLKYFPLLNVFCRRAHAKPGAR